MDIRRSIKTSVSRRLKELNQWDSDKYPNIYELDNFLRKSGYRLTSISKGDNGTLSIVIDTKNADYINPPILYNPDDETFSVEITKHDPLNASDLADIIEGYETALGVLKYLESLDLSKLEVE